jgi:hypothetical protein
MTALGLDVQRMAGFCNDGATTTAGVKSGVAARLKVVNLRIVAVRCVAHRTALVMSDTAKSSPELQAVDSELRQVPLKKHKNMTTMSCGCWCTTSQGDSIHDSILSLEPFKY